MYQDNDFIADIVKSCERIIAKTRGRQLEEFLETEDLHDIVVRQFTIIGEAARNLSEDAKEQFPDVPWHLVSGMRNRLVHDYRGTDLREVWRTIQIDIPELLRHLRS
jgi:uncharacterized protein with HEPN domain